MSVSRKNRTRRNRKQNGGSSSMPAMMNQVGGSSSGFPKLSLMGGAKIPAVGSKSQVFHGTAKHTSGGLKRKDLMKTKNGRIVSRRKHAAGKKAIKNLRKLGYIAKKGTFKLFTKKSKRGGSASMNPLSLLSGL
jgi:hypothetical protein